MFLIPSGIAFFSLFLSLTRTLLILTIIDLLLLLLLLVVFELCILNEYRSAFATSTLQFGFKQDSPRICAMV